MKKTKSHNKEKIKMENSKVKNATVKLFGVYDIKAERLIDVYKAVDLVSATRSFEASVNNPQSMLNKYPTDFKLVSVAEVDEKIMTIEAKTFDVVVANDLLKEIISNDPTSEEE